MTTDPFPGAPTPPTTRKPMSAVVRRLLLGGAFAATFLAGGLVMTGAAAMAMDGAMGGAMHGQMHARMQAHLDKMLAEVDATADQKARINADLERAFQAMAPMHAQMSGTHADLHRLLAAPTIDRAALEQLRASRIAALDQSSKVMVAGIADAAEVLTPAQRAKLAGLMAQQRHGPPS